MAPLNQIAYVLPTQLSGNTDPVTSAPIPGLLLQASAQVLASDNSQVRPAVLLSVVINFSDDVETVSSLVADAFHEATADDLRVDPNAEVLVFLGGRVF